jgi:hypothetical protein
MAKRRETGKEADRGGYRRKERRGEWRRKGVEVVDSQVVEGKKNDRYSRVTQTRAGKDFVGTSL